MTKPKSIFLRCTGVRIWRRADIEPMHVAAYIRGLGEDFEKPTFKHHLAAIRVVRLARPRPGEQARNLLDSIHVSALVCLRDRALKGGERDFVLLAAFFFPPRVETWDNITPRDKKFRGSEGASCRENTTVAGFQFASNSVGWPC
jgi:hypothetical protein